MKCKAVLFDLDGTLLDTLRDIGDSVNRVLKAHGFPVHPLGTYRRYVGDGAARLIRRALPDGSRDEHNVSRCLAGYLADYGKHWKDHTRPYRGVPELLNGLVGREIALAVFSNKPDDFTQLCVNELLAGWKFAAVLGSRPGIPLKPDPAGALEAVREAGVEPAGCVYLGDSGTDMETALAAGMYPVGALWGFRDREELERAGARSVISNPPDLIDLLDQPGPPRVSA